MWISDKEYGNILRKLDALSDRCSTLERRLWWFYDSDDELSPRYPIEDVVSAIAEHLGVKHDPGVKPHIKVGKK